MTRTKSYKATILTVFTILAFGTFLPALAYAAPLANDAKNWQYVNGNSWGQNYSPNTQINKNNVGNIEVKWVFPFSSKDLAPAAIRAIGVQEGVNTPPVVQDGIVYVTSNYLKTYAINAKTGATVWEHDYTFDVAAVNKSLPWAWGGLLSSHIHGIRYWTGGDAILYEGMACDVVAINAKSGKESFRINDLCKDIPGSVYKYFASPNAQASIGTYEKGKQFIIVLPGQMHSTIYAGDSRHVTMGIDMNTKQVLWKVFSYPPQDVATKDWALQECDIGYFQTFPCSDVAAKNRAQLEWDWAQPGQKPDIYGGVTANWGQMIVDEDTGILYTQTGNQGPYTNVSTTPGPRLYGSTIMAIDMNAGKRIWWLQPFPHDPYDYDCNWGGVLAETKSIGKVYMKGCKEGRLYVMDAKTGKPIYMKDVLHEQITLGQISPLAGKEPKDGGIKFHLTDPYSDDMRGWKFITDGRVCNAPCEVYPHFFNGIFATDKTYDPTTDTLYHYANAFQVQVTKELPVVPGNNVVVTKERYNTNTSIIARDASTGAIKWNWFYKTSAQRAALVVTSDLLFSGFTDGTMKFLDKANGKELGSVNLGAPIAIAPTTGQDSDGKQKIFVIAGITTIPQIFGAGYGPSGAIQPGVLVALGLNEKAATASTATVTTTQSTVVTSTSATTVTETTGLPAEITYAVAAIAVIAIIAAAVLVMRKK